MKEIGRVAMRVERETVAIPLSVFGRALKLLWQELFLLGLAGYAWMLLGIFLIPLPPITVGLFYVTNQVAHGNAIGVTTQFAGAWRFLSRSLIWGMINLLAVLFLWADLTYYSALGGDLGIGFVTLAILLALAWIVVQVLALPFLIEAGPRSLVAAYKRAFVLIISQPLFVVGLLIVIALLGLLCWYVPILLGYALAYLALLANVAVVHMLDQRSSKERTSKEP